MHASGPPKFGERNLQGAGQTVNGFLDCQRVVVVMHSDSADRYLSLAQSGRLYDVLDYSYVVDQAGSHRDVLDVNVWRDI